MNWGGQSALNVLSQDCFFFVAPLTARTDPLNELALAETVLFIVVMLSSVFIRLPKAEGEDRTLGGSKEQDVDRCVTTRHPPPPHTHTDSG